MQSNNGPPASEPPFDLDDPIVQALIQGKNSKNSSDVIRGIDAAVQEAEQSKFLFTNDEFNVKPTNFHGGKNYDLPSSNLERLPKMLGAYCLRREIGVGGFSRVFEATRDDSNELFAVKVVRPFGVDSIERLGVEKTVLRKLVHPNLVSVVDAGISDDGDHFLVMPLVSGIRIDRYIEEQLLNPVQIALLFASIADGLQYAHDQGVIHRDVKPGNILVTADGHPVVTDFGLAKLTGSSSEPENTDKSLTFSGAILGTLGYLAPEQLTMRQSEITHAVDIYGLGAALYKSITGKPPADTHSLYKSLKDLESGQPRFARRPSRIPCPRGLRLICLKCLEKSPDKRYASLREAQEDLINFASGNAIRARHKPWSGRMREWAQKEPLTAALMVSLLFTAVLGSLIALILWRVADRERLLAQNMLVTAREILNEGDSLAEQTLPLTAGTLEFRRKRLEASVKLFDKLRDQYPADTGLREDSALSYYRLGVLNLQLKNHEQSRAALDAATELYKRLTLLAPEEPSYAFSQFHCLLNQIYLDISSEPSINRSTQRQAEQIIARLIADFPTQTLYRDAQICLHLQTTDWRNPDSERRLLESYEASRTLKSLLKEPCLEWRHSGTSARRLVRFYLEQGQIENASSWLEKAKIETTDFLREENPTPRKQLDWLEYLEIASHVAIGQKNHEEVVRLKIEWAMVIDQCIAEYPDDPALSYKKQNHEDYFPKPSEQ